MYWHRWWPKHIPPSNTIKIALNFEIEFILLLSIEFMHDELTARTPKKMLDCYHYSQNATRIVNMRIERPYHSNHMQTGSYRFKFLSFLAHSIEKMLTRSRRHKWADTTQIILHLSNTKYSIPHEHHLKSLKMQNVRKCISR